MADIQWKPGTSASLATTQLDALANGSGVLGVEYDNSIAATQNFFGELELAVTFGTAPALGTVVEAYLITAPDGTNYADTVNGATPYAPVTAYIGSFPLRNAAAQRSPISGVRLPPTKFKLFVVNKSGVAFPATGSTIKLFPTKEQSV